MSGLFQALNTSSQSLSAYQRAIEISQNNVNNASTPGYAAQIADFTALSFDLNSGLAGGVAANTVSTRSKYLDDSVRAQTTTLGNAQQQSQSLGGIEGLFDISGTTGIPAAFSKLFNSFSALSVAPADGAARNAVVTAAKDVASGFQQIASSLDTAADGADQQIRSQLKQVDALASEIRGYNVAQEQTGTADAGRDAKLSAALEQLSSLVNISTRPSVGGGTDVLINGQIPLVLGAQKFSLSSAAAPAPASAPANPSGPAPTQISDSEGRDITSQFSGGTLSGLLQFKNSTLAALRGDRNQAGSINTLAKGFADRVNTLLTAGQIAAGPPAVPGVPLFTYDATDATKSAASLAVVAGVTGAQIATITPGPPVVSNGVALSFGDLAAGTTAANQIAGVSYSQYFGAVAGSVGSQLSAQKSSADAAQQSSIQAQSLRSQLSGVSLDTEAVKLTQYQKAYSASAKLITILDQITQTTLDILK